MSFDTVDSSFWTMALFVACGVFVPPAVLVILYFLGERYWPPKDRSSN